MGADVAVQTLNLVACSPKPTLGDVCLRLCVLGVLDAAQHCYPAMLNPAAAQCALTVTDTGSYVELFIFDLR